MGIEALARAARLAVAYFEGPNEDMGPNFKRYETEANNGGKQAYKALKKALATYDAKGGG